MDLISYNKAKKAKELADQIVQGEVDTGVLRTNIDQKLNDLETEYAPKLSEVTTSLTEKPSKKDVLKTGSQRDFFLFQERNNQSTFPNTYSVIGDRHMKFSVGIGIGEYADYVFKKNPNDDFIKFTDVNLSKLISNQSTSKENFALSDITVGTMKGMNETYPSANPYANAVGTTVKYVFDGNEIWFNYLFTTVGGVWNFSIDGTEIKNVSTHTDAVSESEKIDSTIASTLISNNLSNGTHTLTMVFKGDDPDNPSTDGTGTSRGWARNTTFLEDASRVESFYVISYTEGNGEIPVLQGSSNKEFAFQVRPTGATKHEWFPEHNTVGTAYIGTTGFQNVFIDGEKVTDFSPLESKPFVEAKIIQKMEYHHPEVTGVSATLILSETINSKGVSITGSITWEKDAYVNAGYVNMFPIMSEFGKKLLTSNGSIYDLYLSDGSVEFLNEEEQSFGYVALNIGNNSDYYAFVQNFNPFYTLRLSETIADTPYIQHRDETLQKLYLPVYRYSDVKAGDRYNFEGHFGLNKQYSVTDLLT